MIKKWLKNIERRKDDEQFIGGYLFAKKVLTKDRPHPDDISECLKNRIRWSEDSNKGTALDRGIKNAIKEYRGLYGQIILEN